MRETKFIFPYLRRHLWQYLLGILSLFVVDACNVVIPRITGDITNGLAYQSLAWEGILRLLLQVLLYGCLIMLGRFGWRYFLFGAARSVEMELRNDMFGHLETLSMRYYNSNKIGDLMARFTNDLGSVRELVGGTIITTFDATVMLIMVLGNMIRYVDPTLTLVAVLPMVVISIGDIIFAKAVHKRFIEKQEAFSDLTEQAREAVSGIRVIKAFVQERKELYAFAKTNDNAREKNMRVIRLFMTFFPIMETIVGLSSLLTLLYGGRLAITGEIDIGQFVAFNSYVGMLVWPMLAVGECITNLAQGTASLKRIHEIFDARAEITDSSEKLPVEALKGDISIDRLTFAYPDTDGLEVLKDISVHVRQGETLGILGRTGSGKTTLISLLSRLYEVLPGMIRIDGIPVAQIPLDVLRRDIAVVPQDNFLFSDTIGNNIAFGVTDPGQDAIRRAAEDACIHDNIIEFPDGYDTLLGERGTTISGGQKQRTSIARALIKDAPVLILDDSLSAVDTDTEEKILTNLKKNRENKTTIIIAHRLSTMQSADHILVLEEGRCAEYGTHEELMALDGIYRAVWEKQQLEKQLEQEGSDAE